ncbi:MAG: trypsin-like peptidase domain-containing protein [Steroidobacteraceae bacterium]
MPAARPLRIAHKARPYILAACLFAWSSAGAADAAGAPGAEASVVQVFAYVVPPNPTRPWTRQTGRELTGSGVVIGGNRILTNAHVVSYASRVQIQGSGDGSKATAEVEFSAPGIDLAVLRIDDPEFFRRHPPLLRSDAKPAIKDGVSVYGYPRGGSSLSITQGIVSRIEYAGYQYPVSGLRMQIDAAVNPGNSGGPVVAGDRMIGIARSTLTNSQNINYVIPNEEIEIFLADIEDGSYDGKPMLYDELEPFESPVLRDYLKLPASAHGALVRRPNTSLPANPLREWDLITHIGNARIDDQGMVAAEGGLRLRFAYMIQKLGQRDAVPLTVLRDGKEFQLRMPLSTDRRRLIADLAGTQPPYFIYGPVAFSTLSAQFVSELARVNPPAGTPGVLDTLTQSGSPLATLRAAFATPEREELVFIPSPYFPHPLTTGYRNSSLSVVDSLNGKPVRSLAHLVELLRDLDDEHAIVRFQPANVPALVLPRTQMQQATEKVLQENAIRDFASPELMRIWQAKPMPAD